MTPDFTRAPAHVAGAPSSRLAARAPRRPRRHAGFHHELLAAGLALAATVLVAASPGRTVSAGLAAESSPAAVRASANEPLTPVLVELFTSQGCSSCPPADAILRTLERNQPVEGALIVPLSEHVDYWNRLGWRDPFSSPRFSARQRTYADALDIPSLFTPMIVVDGRLVVIGSDSGDVRRAIVEAAATPKTRLAVRARSRPTSRVVEVTATVLPARAAHDGKETGVWLAITETGLATDVMGGENLFRRLRHTGVVRHLERLGTGTVPRAGHADWTLRRSLRLEPDWKRSDLRVVVFLQEPRTAAIIGAATAAIG